MCVVCAVSSTITSILDSGIDQGLKGRRQPLVENESGEDVRDEKGEKRVIIKKKVRKIPDKKPLKKGDNQS